RLYQNNFEAFDELKSEYISFLYNTSQLNKLYEILITIEHKPAWWLDEAISFESLKTNLNKLLDSKDNGGWYSAKELFANDIAYSFIIIEGINNGTLKSEFALQTFKDHIFNSQNVILKSYITALIIDYFALMDEEEKKKFFMPMRYETPPYDILTFLHSQANLEGGKIYYNKYRLRTQKLLNSTLNLPPKKIAICLYGVLRGAWKENLEEIIEVMAKPLNADCFLFSWDEYQEWPSLMGGYYWAHRAFRKDIAEKCPKEIETHAIFRANMPYTYKALSKEYNIKIDKEQLEQFINSNPNIKGFRLEDQTKFYYNDHNSKLYYGLYSTFKTMESYEYNTKALYDIVIISRVDVRPHSIDIDNINNIQPNEIADGFMSWGSGSGCFVGHREAVKNYISIWDNKEIIKSNEFINAFGNNHEMGYKYPSLYGYNIIKPITSFEFYYTTALKGIKFPDISKEIFLDLSNLKIDGKLSQNKIDEINNFFDLIRLNYGLPSSKARAFDRISDSTAKSRIKNQLSYKLGQAMIENSKSLLGYIRMPYILSYIKETHQKEQKLYQEKIKANPSLKLPPLETYPDYNEAIKIKNHLSYKLGEALINADKSKLKLGYLSLWFKCKNITKEHKDNHKNSPNNPNH
ncbi:hypothetical protein, partial [Campylobacter lanienae]|uniref:hypothetical protein n=1 Tax=Campylobacter lanienae TaxID=75658 RepID=UPI0031199755